MQIKNKELIDKQNGIWRYTLICKNCNLQLIEEGIRGKELKLLSMKCPRCNISKVVVNENVTSAPVNTTVTMKMDEPNIPKVKDDIRKHYSKKLIKKGKKR